MVCRGGAANFVLDRCTPQMNKGQDYGGCADNQLRALEHAGVLTGFDWASQAREALAARAEGQGLNGEEAEAHAKLHGPQPGQRGVPATSLLPTGPDGLAR